MNVQVRDRLARVRAAVNHDAVTAFADAQFTREFLGGQKQLTEQLLIRFVSLGQPRNNPLRHDQNMHRRLRIHVLKGEHVVIFGPSGSGKSTLLRTINLLEEPQEGSVRVLGVEYGAAAPKRGTSGWYLLERRAERVEERIVLVGRTDGDT